MIFFWDFSENECGKCPWLLHGILSSPHNIVLDLNIVMNVVRRVDVVEFYMINQEGGKIKTERNF